VTALLLCIDLTVRRGVGALYFRKGSPDNVQAALKWDPSNPRYYDSLATLMHLYADDENPNEIIRLYRNAVGLSPHDAELWADLGAAYDWAGSSSQAVGAFQKAHFLFPNSPQINWRLANFDFRTGRTLEALSALKRVLSEDSSAQRNVFMLVTRATNDRKAILNVMLPPQGPLLFAYLNFEAEKGDLDGAQEVWARIIQSNLEFNLHQAFPYLDALIHHRKADQLAETWSILTKRFPALVGPDGDGSNLVTNGSFRRDILNGGLDWRVVPVEGVTVGLSVESPCGDARALRITFDGSRNLDYSHVVQYVRVQPATRYRFSSQARAEGITTDTGPRFEISDAYNMNRLFASTENVLGTSDWSEQHAEFTTGSDTHLLLIRIARPPSSKLDNKIFGSVWVTHVLLKPEP
jgi:hypothetical protein